MASSPAKFRSSSLSSARTMHKVFSVNEIVHEILQYPNKTALVAVALTCKSLSGLALNSLWKEISSLEPLRQLLSKDDLDRGSDDPRAANSWTQFKTYTARIRALSFENPATPEQLNFVKALMDHYPPADPPLPSLQTLGVVEEQAVGGLALCTTLLAHPGLRTVTLASPSPCALATALRHLQLRAPDVQHLVVGGASGLLPLLSKFSRLQSAVYNDPYGNVDRRALLALAKLPRLRKLTIQGQFKSESFDAAAKVPKEPFFPALETLVIPRVVDLYALSAMLFLVKQLLVLIVGCTLPQPHAPKAVHTLAQAIASCERVRTLRLTLSGTTVVHVQEECLQPLAKLQHLDHVALRDDRMVTKNQQPLADLGAIKMATHWRSIRVLHLQSKHWQHGRGAPHNLHILATLAEHCPRLCELQTAIAVKGAPARDKTRHARIRRTTWFRLVLYVKLSPFAADAFATAEYICDIYPRIKIVFGEVESEPQRKWQEEWRRVGGLVKSIAAAREEWKSEVLAEAAEQKKSE